VILQPGSILRRPIALTEKAARLKNERNQVIFEVAPSANKIQIKDAVEKLFGVEVARVNTLVVRGKPRRIGRRRTKRPNWKKAIVTLRPGSDIEFFTESPE